MGETWNFDFYFLWGSSRSRSGRDSAWVLCARDGRTCWFGSTADIRGNTLGRLVLNIVVEQTRGQGAYQSRQTFGNQPSCLLRFYPRKILPFKSLTFSPRTRSAIAETSVRNIEFGGPSPHSVSRSISGLCLAGFLRLSGITRVPAGASPDLRARRRASVPFSRRSFFLFLMSALFCNDLAYGSPALIDGFVRVRKRARIRIGDVNISKRLAADFVRRLAGGPFRVE